MLIVEIVLFLAVLTGMIIGLGFMGIKIEEAEVKEEAMRKAMAEGRYNEILADESKSLAIRKENVERKEVVHINKADEEDEADSSTYSNEAVEAYFDGQVTLPVHIQEKLAVPNLYVNKLYELDPDDKFFKRYLPLLTEAIEASELARDEKQLRDTIEMFSDAIKKYHAQVTGKSEYTVDINKSVLEQLLTQDGLYNNLEISNATPPVNNKEQKSQEQVR